MVPESTSDAQLRSIVVSCKGDETKLGVCIEALWNECKSLILCDNSKVTMKENGKKCLKGLPA